jgi:acetamidase/formamidase
MFMCTVCAPRFNGTGCKVYFPVFVEGANLSMGDMHFSQGDGEVSFCGAIGERSLARSL